MNRDRTTLTLGLFFVVVATLLLVAASRLPLVTELLQVAMLLLGLVSMAAIATFVRYVEGSGGGAPLVQITFNEAQARSVLDTVADVEHVERTPRSMSAPPWEPTSDALLLQDPALALAKLRIDIERELRRLAYERDLSLDAQRLTIPRLMDVLVKQNVLEPQVVVAINDVLPACNQAIHGADIPPDVALSVLNVGTDILGILRRSETDMHSSGVQFERSGT